MLVQKVRMNIVHYRNCKVLLCLGAFFLNCRDTLDLKETRYYDKKVKNKN